MILVAGSTGSLGLEICRRLRAQGAAVRALARPTSAPDKIDRLLSLGADVVRGDLKESAPEASP
jgi:uncharacterized protein YbjT (DUF2867 family)